MRSLITTIALAVCASGAIAAGAYISDGRGNTVEATSGGSSISSNSSLNSGVNSSSSVSSIITNNSGQTSSTIVNSTQGNLSSCSTDVNGSYCEVSCQAPRVAQCVKSPSRRAPSCYCQ